MSRRIALFMIMSGKNAHTPPKLSTTGQKIPSTFIMTKLLLKLFIPAKLIHLLLWC